MEEEFEGQTTLIFKGSLKDFEFWFEVMKERYKNFGKTEIEAIIQDFSNALQ